ncbi:MAG: MBOAT family protein [Magnetococcales bacterium]|nr:MBOAT family protein [Magnetococcales bacterium]
MQFTSYSFILFMLLFVAAWKHLGRWRIQLLNVASLIFYGAWNPYYIILLVFSSLIDYYGSLALVRWRHADRLILALALGGNLSILIFFKYFLFLQTLTCDTLSLFSIVCQPTATSFLLPVGISFYTFQSMAYTIDVYRRELEPSRNLSEYFCYISFFPQLVAGPIERATHLLPQIRQFASNTPIPLEWRESGSLILRGLFKKMVIANNLAAYVDPVFTNMSQYSLTTILLATLFFSIQIYGDFSGYSDIAKGLARMIGVRLMDNFNYPYSATSMREFWHRWHISLSLWLRDYLYVALGGNRHGKWRTLSNLMATMTLGGIWHGASYNFLLWGFYHGLLLSFERLEWRLLPKQTPVAIRWVSTMLLVGFGWFLFRLESIADLGVLAWKLRTITWVEGINQPPDLVMCFAFAFYVLVMTWELKVLKRRLMPLHENNPLWRGALVFGLLGIYHLTAPSMDRMFIYFQF